MSIKLRLRGERPAQIVVDDYKWSQAARDVQTGGGNGLGGKDTLFELGNKVVSECDLRIVRVLAQDLLRDGAKRKCEASGEERQDECVEDESGPGEGITQHREMLLDD